MSRMDFNLDLFYVSDIENDDNKKVKKWCLILAILIVLIVLGLVGAIVSLVVFVPSPQLRLESAHVSHLNYSTSCTPIFSLIMNVHLSLKNRGFGRFDYYANKNVTVLYGNFNIGDGVVSNGSVKARETKEINVTLNLSSENIHVLPINTHNFTKGIVSGSLNLTMSTELRGKKYALNLFKKRRTVPMACIFRLNFNSSSIDDIQCP